MKVLLTGANGHIGTHIVRKLLQHGHEVVAFVRESANLRSLEGLDVELCTGDIRDAQSLIAAANGCDAVIHSAAVYNMFAATREEIVDPVLVGIENVCRAMAQNNINRLVYTSSIAAVGFSHSPTELRTPKDWHQEPQNLYFSAKHESEKRAVALAEQYGIEMVRICPSVVLGPFDYRVTPSTGLIFGLVSGMATTWEGGTNLVDVRDVAEVHVQALTKGQAGQRFIVGGENLHAQEIGAILEAFTGVKPDHFGLGRDQAFAVAEQLEAEAKAKGEQPAMTKSIVHEQVERYGYFDTSLTNETFGLQPRQAKESIRDCLLWLDGMGLFDTAVSDHLKQVQLQPS